MFRSDLLDAINSGDAWAFVGSGVSSDAGAPSWGDLVAAVAATLGVSSDSSVASHMKKGDWPAALGRAEELADRLALEDSVATALATDDSGRPLRPGRLHRLLADMPFAGYITTNFDTLLEDAVSFDPGWASVGNVDDEVRRVAGGANRLVWHVHGALGMNSDRSRLVLTTEDYDTLYADDAPVVRQMRGMLANRRLVFIGFGLQDTDLMELFRVLGRLANPALPIFAIVPDLGRFSHADERRQLLHRLKIDVLTYQVHGDSHAACVDLVELYSALTLKRSLRYGRELPPPRDYDPETTGLLIYNELVLREQANVPRDIRESLVVAWVLTQLVAAPQRLPDLHRAFGDVVSVLATQLGSDAGQGDEATLTGALDLATERGWVNIGVDLVRLTAEGESAVKDRSARAALQSDRFSAALISRSRSLIGDTSAADRVATVARSYFDDCVERRALGIARTVTPGRFSEQEYHAVSLLQGLKNFLARVRDAEEARALVALVTGVLSDPVPAEVQHIGTSVQARFGLHLLGYDSDTLRVRGEDFQHTVFVVDSNTLIPLLARSSLAHAEGVELIARLVDLGAPLLTTKLLSDEVVEHAQYARDTFGTGLVDLSPSALESAIGRSGSRSNAFLEGLIVESARGEARPSIDHYLAEALGVDHSGLARISAHASEIAAKCQSLGVKLIRLEDLDGYTKGVMATIRTAADRLAVRRGATYRHDRQVRAEAEAQVIVLGIRRGDLSLPGETFRNAYFISNTRVIDDEAGERVTMSRDNALLWLATLRPYSPSHAAAIYGGLLWELQERRVDLVPHETIRRVFRPLLVSSRDQLNEELARHRDLIETQYGGEGADAMANTAPENVPTVLATYQAEQNAGLAQQLADARAQIAALRENLEQAEQAAERSQRKRKGKDRYDRRMKRNKNNP